MKKFIISIFIIIALLVGGFFVFRGIAARQQATLVEGLETVPVQYGALESGIGATGNIRSNQSALLFWEIAGQVGEVRVKPGDQVAANDILATLKTTSLPPNVILAQTEFVNSTKALDNLLNSTSQQAAALQAVDAAENALEDALNPEVAQAQALEKIALAEKDVETAQRNYDMLTTPVSPNVIIQTNANLLLAENELNQTLADIKKMKFIMLTRSFLRQALRKALDGLEVKRTQDQIRLEDTQARYDSLLTPPDPLDVEIAEAALWAAHAQLNNTLKEWDRIKDGTSLAEIAILEARLADAQREWERVKTGPNPDDMTILETQIIAAQATLNLGHLQAPFAGVISVMEAQPADQVTPGQLAIQLDDVSRLLVDVPISEVDINQIKIGQTAKLTFDAVLAKEYIGQVVEIALVGTEMLGTTTFNVTVEILDVDKQIKPGMSATVTIVTNQVASALLIPNRAIRIVNGERVVYVLGDETPFTGVRRTLSWPANPNSRIRPVSITVGASSGSLSEVLSGDLNPGDLIIINPPSEMLSIPGSTQPNTQK